MGKFPTNQTYNLKDADRESLARLCRERKISTRGAPEDMLLRLQAYEALQHAAVADNHLRPEEKRQAAPEQGQNQERVARTGGPLATLLQYSVWILRAALWCYIMSMAFGLFIRAWGDARGWEAADYAAARRSKATGGHQAHRRTMEKAGGAD
ncbi:hypothetical protein ABEF95_000667 [Exophiala dermatitidis]